MSLAAGTYGGALGRIVRHDPADYRREDLSLGLTPLKARAMIRAADDGDLATALQLFEELEDKDSRLQSVLNTRRMALTGMNWEIVSAAEHSRKEVDKTLADEAAAYCNETLGELPSFEPSLADLSLAIGPGLAVAELVWEFNRLAAIEPVPSARLFMDFNRDKRVRVRLRQGDAVGVPADPPNLIAHMPHAKHGLPMRGSLMRSLALVYLVRCYALKDWAVFMEVFGMPVRIAYYEPNATSEEKTEMLNMLKLLGSDAVGIFSKSMQLEIKGQAGQAGVTGAPFEGIINWGAKEMAVAVLGQNLTTDSTGGTGTLATAQVHDQVREDILKADAAAEARMVRSGILAPMVKAGFKMFDAPVPLFQRKPDEVVDRIQEAQLFQHLQGFGFDLTKGYVAERLGVPLPTGANPEDILTPRPAAASSFAGTYTGAAQ